VSFTDDFERASLGTDWTTREGTPQIYGSSDLGAGSNDGNLTQRNLETYSNDQFSEILISAINAGVSEVTAAVRLNPSGSLTAYLVQTDNSTYIRLSKLVAGNFSVMVSSSTAGNIPGVGDKMKISVAGTTVKGYKNGTEVLSTTDTEVTTGKPGVGFFRAGAPPLTRVESWEGGDGTGPAVLVQGAAVLTAAATVAAAAIATFSGAASLAASAVVSATTSVAHTGAAVLPAATNMLAAGTAAHTGIAALPAAATLAATGVLALHGSAALAAGATLAAIATVAHTGISALTAAATLAASGTVTVPSQVLGIAVLAAAATMTAAARATYSGAATLTAAATLLAESMTTTAPAPVLPDPVGQFTRERIAEAMWWGGGDPTGKKLRKARAGK